jgi:membrane-associated protease RseP (regulator of RpoE activity)
VGKHLLLHIALFVLTVISTWLVGGVLYSACIMTILLAHEMGHYTMARRHRVPATLPYFIPFPVQPFGTFGAVIKMRGAIGNKKALFDIGVAGPLSGFILALPCIFYGVAMSTAVPLTPHLQQHGELFNEPLLFKLAAWMIVGNLPPNYVLMLHPVGYAGWVGLFVTALNLLPIGQLDGGHVMYAVLGRRSRLVSRFFIPALLVMAVFANAGWTALVILLLIFGIHHPDPVDPETPLDSRRKAVAVLVLVIFILSFMPAPFPGTSFLELVQKLIWK